MSHTRPDTKIPKHRLSQCKKGRHQYGVAQHIGAGIERRLCLTCAAVTIDLTSLDDSLDTSIAQTHNTITSLSIQEP